MNPWNSDHGRYYTREQAISQWAGWAWGAFLGQVALVFGFLIFGLAHFAYATPPSTLEPASYRKASSTIPSSSPSFQVRGELNWDGEVATVREESTGRVFILSHSDQARTFWNQGVRKVTLEGGMHENSTWTIQTQP